MIHDRMKSARLIALFLLGWVLFNYPILSLFNEDRMVMGIPILFLFIFGAWCLMIGVIVWITRDRSFDLEVDSRIYKD